uniref:Putative secreted protein n=1 Tax=Anopheles marajoara TaxID=58244 RepID=A0A2M4C9Z3_9DIPT
MLSLLSSCQSFLCSPPAFSRQSPCLRDRRHPPAVDTQPARPDRAVLHSHFPPVLASYHSSCCSLGSYQTHPHCHRPSVRYPSSDAIDCDHR